MGFGSLINLSAQPLPVIKRSLEGWLGLMSGWRDWKQNFYRLDQVNQLSVYAKILRYCLETKFGDSKIKVTQLRSTVSDIWVKLFHSLQWHLFWWISRPWCWSVIWWGIFLSLLVAGLRIIWWQISSYLSAKSNIWSQLHIQKDVSRADTNLLWTESFDDRLKGKLWLLYELTIAEMDTKIGST